MQFVFLEMLSLLEDKRTNFLASDIIIFIKMFFVYYF